jgi:hypothetical protein
MHENGEGRVKKWRIYAEKPPSPLALKIAIFIAGGERF